MFLKNTEVIACVTIRFLFKKLKLLSLSCLVGTVINHLHNHHYKVQVCATDVHLKVPEANRLTSLTELSSLVDVSLPSTS